MAVKDLCPSTKAVSSRSSHLGVDGYDGNLFGMNDFFSKNAKAWTGSGQSYIQRSLFHSFGAISWKDFKPALHCFCSQCWDTQTISSRLRLCNRIDWGYGDIGIVVQGNRRPCMSELFTCIVLVCGPESWEAYTCGNTTYRESCAFSRRSIGIHIKWVAKVNPTAWQDIYKGECSMSKDLSNASEVKRVKEAEAACI